MLARELYPGKYRPTVSHAFFALLHEKKMSGMVFTQNVDCLERLAGVPPGLIVGAHGTFATQSCIECKNAFPSDLMRKAIEGFEPPRCLRPDCDGLVKPDIVFLWGATSEEVS